MTDLDINKKLAGLMGQPYREYVDYLNNKSDFVDFLHWAIEWEGWDNFLNWYYDRSVEAFTFTSRDAVPFGLLHPFPKLGRSICAYEEEKEC